MGPGLFAVRGSQIGHPMDVSPLGTSAAIDMPSSGVSWPAITAGAVATAALSLLLLSFGTGIGLSSISPWAGSGVSATTFKIGSGIYLVIVAVMASSIGGYLAARLRTKRTGLHTNEVYFRDTAHGLLAWALATLLSAGVLGAVTTHLASGGATTAAAVVGGTNPADFYIDKLFRADPAAQTTAASPTVNGADTLRAEMSRLWTSSFRDGNDLSAGDRAYVARMVASRTGLSQPEAEKRVSDVITDAKAAADAARKAAVQLSLWLTVSLLFGAFAAGLAAVEGGQLRDGTWNNHVLTPRHV
jgi:hypothetical protein